MENKLNTLDVMRKESFLTAPEQAFEATEEYFKNIKSEEAKKLNKMLSDKEYKEKFETAITHTSLIVFVAAFKATQPEQEVDFDQYIREYLFFARNDDKLIYDMRIFYLTSLDSKEMGIGQFEESDDLSEEQMTILKREMKKASKTYDQLIEKLKTQYLERSIHLK